MPELKAESSVPCNLGCGKGAGCHRGATHPRHAEHAIPARKSARHDGHTSGFCGKPCAHANSWVDNVVRTIGLQRGRKTTGDAPCADRNHPPPCDPIPILRFCCVALSGKPPTQTNRRNELRLIEVPRELLGENDGECPVDCLGMRRRPLRH